MHKIYKLSNSYWKSRLLINIKRCSILDAEQDGRGVGECGIHLSLRIHQEYTFRHRSVRRTPAERDRSTWPVDKNIQNHAKFSRTKEPGGETGLLVGLYLPLVGGRTEAGVWSHTGAIVWVGGEIFKADSETADLWQPKRNENQTVLATNTHTPDKEAGPLGDTVGSWSLGIVEQSKSKGCCWLWRDRSGGCKEGDSGGKRLWKKAGWPWKQGDTAESCIGGEAIIIASLSPNASMAAEQ